jgi:hypothetical protein
MPNSRYLQLGLTFAKPQPGLGPGVGAQVASQQSLILRVLMQLQYEKKTPDVRSAFRQEDYLTRAARQGCVHAFLGRRSAWLSDPDIEQRDPVLNRLKREFG